MPAILSEKRLRLDETHASQADCLLKTLAATTFDSHNPAADQQYADVKIALLVAAYDPSAYDFFAGRLDSVPVRLQHGLMMALVDAGEPDATRMYFDMRRTAAQPVSAATPLYYRAMLDGHCAKAPCSPRLTESIAIVHANLDIAAAELRAVAALPPRHGASGDELRHMDEMRRDALSLLERVQRMR